MKEIRAAEPVQRTGPFAVDDVEPALTPILTETLNKHAAARLKRKLIYLPEPEKPVTNVLLEWLNSRPEVKAGVRAQHFVNGFNPLVDAVATAFSQHRPLTLSPDAIWLTIEQGFAHHIADNAETLRHRLVRHEGKRTLTAKIADLSGLSFERAIAQFSAQIREATNPVLHETLLCDFSTTTPAIRTASEIVLMDSFSKYFEYVVGCICGIPKVTVTGCLQDWERIRARIELLDTFELGWWVARLRPILDEFIRTVQGCPNAQFWQAIYKPKRAYAAEKVTGWIADLFPYLGDGPKRYRNRMLEVDREEWAVPVEKGVGTRVLFDRGPGVSKDGFPSGLASVPVRLTLPDHSEMKVEFIAGYFGMEQDTVDMSLSPVISWVVSEPERAVAPKSQFESLLDML